MKHSLLISLFMVMGAMVIHAQTPQNKKRVVVFDFSDTWCSPCGEFGVAISDTVDHKLNSGDMGYLIGIKGSFHPSSPASINALGASTLFDNFGCWGVPTFMVGNYQAQAPTGNNANDITGIMNAAVSFDANPVIASTAANVSISGNVLTVNARAKFWESATGEYYMTAFLAENKIVAAQAQNSPNTVHLHVLKGAMTTTGTALVATPWGEQVGSSFIAANTQFSKTYRVNIDTGWQKENLEVYVLIFKKNGNTYEYVNAEKAQASPTGIDAVATDLEQAVLYPNPAGNTTSLDLTLNRAMNVNINITDASGRSVYKASHALHSGKNKVVIPASELSTGLYDVTIAGEDQSRVNRKLAVYR